MASDIERRRVQLRIVHDMTDKEARIVAKIGTDTPYLRDILIARARVRRDYLQSGKRSRTDYHRTIRVWYESHGWLTKDKKPDVWKMVRHFEERFTDSPAGRDYRTPSYKHARNVEASERKLKRSLEY